MNENRLFYRLFLNFSITTVLGFLTVLIEYSVCGIPDISVRSLWYVPVSGAVISVMFEFLFVDILPVSGKDLKREVLWRNRLIAGVVNAIIVAVLGRMMLGFGSLITLLLISVGACVAVVIIAAVLSSLRHRMAIKEMNRRLQQLNSIKGDCDLSDSE